VEVGAAVTVVSTELVPLDVRITRTAARQTLVAVVALVLHVTRRDDPVPALTYPAHQARTRVALMARVSEPWAATAEVAYSSFALAEHQRSPRIPRQFP